MFEVIEIPPGQYLIGDESIPNAGPQHRRKLTQSVWIDARPVSWEHFECFVQAGGYSPELLKGKSVDQRMRQLIDQFDEINPPRGNSSESALSQPITGLTWFEAAKLAEFYRARLPYEIEWEIVNAGSLKGGAAVTDRPGRGGFAMLIGSLQEWTLDAFSKAYWRADFDKRGVAWNQKLAGTDVAIRGAGPDDMFRHVSYRFASSPDDGHIHRGFRRVWESRPTKAEIVPSWKAA